MKIMKVIEFPQIVQLVEIYGAAAKCLSLRTLVNRVLLAQSKARLANRRCSIRVVHHGEFNIFLRTHGQLAQHDEAQRPTFGGD